MSVVVKQAGFERRLASLVAIAEVSEQVARQQAARIDAYQKGIVGINQKLEAKPKELAAAKKNVRELKGKIVVLRDEVHILRRLAAAVSGAALGGAGGLGCGITGASLVACTGLGALGGLGAVMLYEYLSKGGSR